MSRPNPPQRRPSPTKPTPTLPTHRLHQSRERLSQDPSSALTRSRRRSQTPRASARSADDDGADSRPSASIGNVAVDEGDTGELDATFTVTLSRESGETIEIDYASLDDSAIAPGDYGAADGKLTFAPEDRSETVTVKVKGDLELEGVERFHLDLSSPVNATLFDSRGTATITDNESTPAISVLDAGVIEGNAGERDASFMVSLSAPSSRPTKVSVNSVAGSASAPSDFAHITPRLTFAPADRRLTRTSRSAKRLLGAWRL